MLLTMLRLYKTNNFILFLTTWGAVITTTTTTKKDRVWHIHLLWLYCWTNSQVHCEHPSRCIAQQFLDSILWIFEISVTICPNQIHCSGVLDCLLMEEKLSTIFRRPLLTAVQGLSHIAVCHWGSVPIQLLHFSGQGQFCTWGFLHACAPVNYTVTVD